MQSDDLQFDVALSFAGEDRTYVEAVASRLRDMEIRVFYDKYETATLWGKNLYEHLQDIYQNKARYTVLFISRHYADKVWTTLERQSAQARAFVSHEEYLLPARFDSTEIPGVLPTVGFVDLNAYSPVELAELIKLKIGPIRRYEFMPREPDALLEFIGANTDEEKRVATAFAHSFFESLRLMTEDERKLVVTTINHSCPQGPPDNVHLNIELLSRLIGMSTDGIAATFARLDCLSVESSIRKSKHPRDHLCKGTTILKMRYAPLLQGVEASNATYVAIAIVDLMNDVLCPDCRELALRDLDFSFLSNLTGYPDARQSPPAH
ncbi:MAG: toll/interleukin-1 receptor domain-containing protein [Chloroflexota bacterium]